MTAGRKTAVYAAPEPAARILAALAPGLIRLCGSADDLALGGGTALASRWDHRISTDISLFVTPEAFGRVREGWMDIASELGAVSLAGGRGWARGTLPGGDFSISTTPDVLPERNAARIDRVATWGLRLESSAEILAKKLRLRMLGSGVLVARDLYDIYAASEFDRNALELALGAIAEDDRRMLAIEVRSRGKAAMGGRDLIRPHRPEWVADLPNRAAELMLGKTFERSRRIAPKRNDDPSPGF